LSDTTPKPPEPAAKQEPRAPTEAEIGPENDGREAFTIRLQPRHAAWLRDRAARHGEAVERHLETIVRNFKGMYDPERHV